MNAQTCAVALCALLLFLPARSVADDAERLWRGHRALVEDRHEDALAAYREAQRHGSLFGGLDTLIDAVEARRRLGAIAPVDTHRVCMIFVTQRVDVARPGVASHVDPVAAQPRPDVTDVQREQWHVYLGVLKRVVEAFSGGAWTVTADERTATATVPEGTPFKAANPDHLGLGRFFFESVGDYDTYVVVSSATSPSYGLARRWPFVEGVLYGPHRGVVDLGASPSLLTLIHELFHVLEWSSGGIGGPSHGFEADKRHLFPGWRGTSELDYYRWHFESTLPRIGWRRLQMRQRFVPVPERSAAARDRIAALYERVPLLDRLSAKKDVEDGLSLAGRDPAGAQRAFEHALALSPYLPEALEPLIQTYRRQGKVANARALTVRLNETKAASGFVDLGPRR